MEKFTEARKRAPGGGRKPKPPSEKRVKVAITMRPDLYEATAGNRSAMIEEALDKLFTTHHSPLNLNVMEKKYEVQMHGFPDCIDQDSKCIIEMRQPVIVVEQGLNDEEAERIAKKEGIELSWVIETVDKNKMYYCKPIEAGIR